MSTWLPDGITEWGGRPVARSVADASPRVPGLTTGARCTVEGTVRMKGGRPVIWNPLYRLEPADG